MALQHGVVLAKPSIGELEQFVGRSLREPRALDEAARALIGSGRVEVLAVTPGHEGALLAAASGTIRLRAPKADNRPLRKRRAPVEWGGCRREQ